MPTLHSFNLLCNKSHKQLCNILACQDVVVLLYDLSYDKSTANRSKWSLDFTFSSLQRAMVQYNELGAYSQLFSVPIKYGS